MMTSGIIRQVVSVICFIGLMLLLGCQEKKKCSCKDTANFLQEYRADGVIAKTIRTDHGAYGYSVVLQICDNEGYLIEEINLRGEDYLPVLDSLVGNNVYVSYSFPQKGNINKLNFKDVVIGKARYKKESLKFNYFFYSN